MLKHKRDIVQQQVQLKRVADVTIDLFALAAVTSRASASLLTEPQPPGAYHEALLCRAFTAMAGRRIEQNLRDMRAAAEEDADLAQVADEMFAAPSPGYIPPHPSGV